MVLRLPFCAISTVLNGTEWSPGNKGEGNGRSADEAPDLIGEV